jgi:site-specific DNA recombinase
MIRAELHLAR